MFVALIYQIFVLHLFLYSLLFFFSLCLSGLSIIANTRNEYFTSEGKKKKRKITIENFKLIDEKYLQETIECLIRKPLFKFEQMGLLFCTG